MNILVTGGAGFLGSHLCNQLQHRGHEVQCIDDLSTGSVDRLHPDVYFIEGDVRQAGWLFDEPVDQIYHLACPASPVAYQISPLRTTDVGYNGTRAVLELAELHKARLVIASTSEVYGQPLEHPQRETLWSHVNPLGPRACYDISKAAAEVLALAYQRERSLDVRIARIHNTYGPGMSPTDGRVVSNFIVQALRGEPLTIYGDGVQTRCFCYVDDMILGLIRLMNVDQLPDPPVINLGSDDEHTIRAVAEIINRLAGGSGIQHKELPQDDPALRRPDLSLARKWLDWRAAVSLRAGLIRTIEYFKEQLK